MCSYIWPKDPVLETTFYGNQICGKRGGDSYSDVVRPDINNKCPNNTVACSNKTSAQNTICYPQIDLEAKCPVTSLKFVAKENKTEW